MRLLIVGTLDGHIATAGKLALDSMNMPILKKDFDRMARYGKAGQKAVLIIRRRAEQQQRAIN